MNLLHQKRNFINELIINENYKEINNLIKKNIDLFELPDNNYLNVLSSCILHNKDNIFFFIYEKIKKTDNLNNNLIGVLHQATRSNNIKILKFLIDDVKVDVNQKDILNKNVLYYCLDIENNYFNLSKVGKETKEYLIENGADFLFKIGVSGKTSKTILHFICEKGDCDFLNIIIQKLKKEDRIKDLNCILSIGNRPPISFAIENNNIDITKILLKNNVELNKLDYYSKIPIEYSKTSRMFCFVAEKMMESNQITKENLLSLSQKIFKEKDLKIINSFLKNIYQRENQENIFLN